MNKNTLGPLAVVLIGVTAFGTMLAFSEQPTACPCDSSSSPNPWYPCLRNPCPFQALTMSSYQINNPTNVTLNLMNPGNVAVTLIAYYVKDSSGNQYANGNWSGPSIAPGAGISINILIDGTAFTFHAGMYYTVEIVTLHRYFTFTIS